MNRLNLNLLRALAVMLEERHVTRAAERLHLTQSALSRQLSQLREHFSDPLLIREGNEYLLSARAKQLLPKIQAILTEVDELSEGDSFDPLQCRRRFSFACTDHVAQFIFPEILGRLRDEAPGIDITFEMWRPEWLGRLGQLPLDIASTTTANLPENVRSIHIGQDSPVCLMAENHPLAACELSIEKMLEYPFLRLNSGGDKDSFFDKALESMGLQRRIQYEVPFFSAAFQALEGSSLLMILPHHIAMNALEHFPLAVAQLPLAEVPKNQYHMCWHEVHDQDPAHSWLRQLIAEVLRKEMYLES
ncbi:LysR family transcriptional regulator [Neptuniibacter caesariensis]|uniref:Putative transcriptional regulator, LysR family protein n=1 Tax=Neptuniibacter caesariensis TaxID=207954 RepID=A0A7U8C875_NEPCE|nr:LysR family transcriptional regulator [Neptuniibacter caesariensis]EAR61654.1 putative transcriptional regulator, LysR family protein [Neptuniibacter caesariensis]